MIVENQIKDILERTTAEIEKSQEEMEKVNENFCWLEGKPIMETSYALMPWFTPDGKQIMLEAEQPATTGGDNKPVSGAAPEGNGAVTSGASGTGDGKDKEIAKQKANEEHVSRHTAIKVYWQTALKVDTALMTIAEERYHAYIRTLKSVLSAVGSETVNNKK